jgi:MFS family permease
VAPVEGRLAGYRRVLAIAPYRRLFVGEGLSSLGDGASYVAVAWLALQLSSPPARPYAVGFSLAAYVIPGALVGLLVAGRLASANARRILVADGLVKVVPLACVPLLHSLHVLSLWAFILLLAGSSLLTSVGRGAFVSVVAANVPQADRFVGNSLIATTEMVTLGLIGPGLGGVLISAVGAPAVIAIGGSTFAALIWAGALLPKSVPPGEVASRPRVTLRGLLRRPTIVWLLALTVIFYGLYGPFETALPIFVKVDLHAGSKMYGLLWAAFGVGACAGGLLAGMLKEIRRIEPFALVVVGRWGLAAVLVGATSLPAVACAGMVMGGAIYAPYPAVTTTTLQNVLPENELAAGAAGWASLVNVVPTCTIALGGPLVAAIGSRATILCSGLATIGLAALVTGARLRSGPDR